MSSPAPLNIISRYSPLSVIARHFPLSVIARLDRAICLRLRLSRFRMLRSSRNMTGWNIIARHFSLSVIARLDRAIHYFLSRFRILRSSRSMTTTKAITFLFVSLPDIFPSLSLPDLIGQSTTLCLVFQILRSSRSMTETKRQ